MSRTVITTQSFTDAEAAFAHAKAIYDSGIAPDGRPFLVMEHYSGDHFGIRARGGRLGVADVLRQPAMKEVQQPWLS